MAVQASPLRAPPLPARPVPGPRRWLVPVASVVVVGALLVFSWFDVHASIGDLIHGLFSPRGLFRDVIPHSVPPKLSAFWEGVKASVLTLAIAVLSIAFAVVFSLVLLPVAARNLAPVRWLYEVTRFGMAILRAIPELIMLLIFNVVLGFSPFSAVLALTLHGIGVQGKLYGEAVEEMDMAPVDALRVAGASRAQVFLHAVLPETWNSLLGLTLYRLDANFRSAVTLGAVGSGGIGFYIFNELSAFQFKVVTTYIIILVVVVMGIERMSTLLRVRLAG